MTAYITNAFQGFNEGILQPFSGACEEVCTFVVDGGIRLSNDFKGVTAGRFRKPVEIIIQKLFDAIPLLALYFFPVHPIPIYLYGLYTVCRVTNYIKNQAFEETLGIAFACEAIRELGRFIVRKELDFLAAAIISVLCSTFHFCKSRS